MDDLKKGLFDFIDNSPTAFHAVATIKTALLENGFEELFEGDSWKLETTGVYFIE